MIYIFCALYHEAEPLIREYGLKKKTDETCFPVFFDEEKQILLTVTGCGMNAATAAVARICTKRTPQTEDFLVNIGTCAKVSCLERSDEACRNVSGKENADKDEIHFPDKGNTVQELSVKTGEVYLCHKITEYVTGRTFYPDILYRHSFVEAEIVTGAVPYRADDYTELFAKYKISGIKIETDSFLYDMEASAIYQAGAYFFGPHQMSFLKVVTDEGNVQEISAEILMKSIERVLPQIQGYLDELVQTGRKSGRQNKKKLEEASEFAQKLSTDMHCSAVMRALVMQQLKYAALAGVDYQGIVGEMYQAGKLPCKDKREGKRCFEELGRKLL